MEQIKLYYEIFDFPLEIKEQDFYSNIAPEKGMILKRKDTGEKVGKIKEIILVMQEYGLSWSEKYRCYTIANYVVSNSQLFSTFLSQLEKNIKQYNQGIKIINEKIIERENTQSYNSNAIISYLLSSFIEGTIDKDSIILDPAAGEGNLITMFPPYLVYAIEPDIVKSIFLKKKGFNVVNDTFEHALINKKIPYPTHIIMNPPFSRQRDIIFFNLAYSILQPGGSMAVIVSENSIWKEINQYNIGFDKSIEEIADILINKFCEKNLSASMREFLHNILELKNSKDAFIYIEGVFQHQNIGYFNTSARTFVIRLQKSYHKRMIKTTLDNILR